jgi:hypothetical protein
MSADKNDTVPTLKDLMADLRVLVERRAQTVAAERIAAAEDRAAEMQTSLDLCLADLQALRAAARAVVARASYRADGVLIDCDCPTGEIGTINAGMIIDHTPQDCSVIALAALLGLDVATLALGEGQA